MNANVIFALCCGTRSSPAVSQELIYFFVNLESKISEIIISNSTQVRVYTAEGVTSELEKSKLEYLQASILVTNSKKIGLLELLIQNMHDFAKDINSLVEWVCHELPTSGSLRKSITECFRGENNNNSGRISSSINVEKLSFDFEFQYLLQV